MMGLRAPKLLRKLSLFTLMLGLALWVQTNGSAQAAQGYAGPQLDEIYNTWAPGSGPDNGDCYFGENNLNEVTGFDGTLLISFCGDPRAGDFTSPLIFGGVPEDFSSIEEYLAVTELVGNDYRFILTVDEGTPKETKIEMSAFKAIRKNPDGTPRVYAESDLFPGGDPNIPLFMYLIPMHPESVGTHTLHIQEIIPVDGGILIDLGTREFTVVPN